MAEEAGEPRDGFGQNKRAVSQPLAFGSPEAWLLNQPLDNFLSEESVSEFRRFLEPISFAPAKRHPFFFVMHLIYRVNQSTTRRLSGKFKSSFLEDRKFDYVALEIRVPIDGTPLLPHWGVEHVKNRYNTRESKVLAALWVFKHRKRQS